MVASSSFYYVDVVAEDLSGQCPEITTTFFSDTSTTLLGGTPSVPTYDEHPLWTANIPGATWIWSSYYVEDPLVVDTRVFVKNFNISNTQSIVSASITLSADNTYKLFANGTLVAEDLTEFNYYEENRKTFDLKPHLQVGDNNLKFEITNLTNPLAPTQERNPAGLLYRVDLVTKENNCNGGGPVNTPPTITLIGANPATTTVGTQFVDPGATAFDQEDGDITDKIVKTGFVDTSLAGTYTLQYSVADSKGLTAVTTRDVIVNPLPPVIKQCTIEIVSDQDTQVIGGGFSQATYNQHPFWTANIPGATWIWKTFLVDDPTVEEFQTFERTFQIASTSHVEAATLVVAADNSYTVSVNGVQIGEDTSEQNYFDENKDTYNVTSYINNDFNRLNFTVKNWAVASSTPESNPAGLLYKLLVTVSGVGENCDGQKPVNNPPTITLIGNNPMNIVVGTQFVDPGATALDQEDGDITDKIVKTGSVNTAVLGSYLLHYLVTDSGGLSAQTSRTVIVGPVATTTAPTVSLSANPSSIVSGNSSTLTWTSTNANSCSAAWTTATSTSGTQVVSPTATTEYAISCVGNGGSASATTTVTVTTGGGGGSNNPSVSLSANPQTINVGATSTLTWTSINTNSCSAAWTTATSTSGTQIVSPATTTEYAITCTGSNGSSTASTTVTVVPANVPVPSVSLNADPATITAGNSSTLSWVSNNTNSCSATWTTATSTSGSQVVSPTATTEYVISCVGNNGSASATTTITVNPAGGGGGGGGGGGDGGGGGIGGRRRDISNLLAPQGEILGATSCAYLRDYLKMGWNNDPVEMLKLKSFLNVFEKEKLSLTTVFDRATFDAVSRFQNKYFDDILEPWGHKAPTGFVYILTKKKINEIYCNTEVILSQADKDEIAAFRALMDSYDVLASSQGYRDGKSAMTADQLQAALSDALAEFEQEGMVVVELKDKDNAKASTTASILKNAAVSVFSLPQLVMSNLEYVAILVVAIVGAYVITRELTGKSEEVVEVGEVERLSESPVIILPAKSKEKEVSTASESGEIVIDGEDEVEGEIKIKN